MPASVIEAATPPGVVTGRITREHGEVTRQAAAGYSVGDVLDLTVADVAAGGWCVARPAGIAGESADSESPGSEGPRDEGAGDAGPGGRPGGESSGFVVFVRHALPGERVRAVITQVTSRFARAEATEIISAAPERVRPPCPYARPGGCGGCDWQHASLRSQRELKAAVIEQQFRRIAGMATNVTVESVPGELGGLGWRTRVKFAVGPDGLAGLHRHRSHEIVRVTDCLIAHPLVSDAGVTRRTWPRSTSVDVAVAPATGQRAVMARGGQKPGSNRRFLTQRAAGRDWRVAAAGFWQVHPGAADVLVEAMLAALRPEAGETALDLFCGAGLFAGVLAEAVGPAGVVIGVERDAAAVRDARHNLRPTPWARVRRGDAAQVLARIGMSGASIAVLDPPRTGIDRALVDLLCGPSALRRIVYVSCDPATLARDVAAFSGHGWLLDGLRAFDAFPMTHHVECLAVLAPPAD